MPRSRRRWLAPLARRCSGLQVQNLSFRLPLWRLVLYSLTGSPFLPLQSEKNASLLASEWQLSPEAGLAPATIAQMRSHPPGRAGGAQVHPTQRWPSCPGEGRARANISQPGRTGRVLPCSLDCEGMEASSLILLNMVMFVPEPKWSLPFPYSPFSPPPLLFPSLH